jgi:hypothetical protein
MATLTIEVSEETLARLQQRALAAGSTPEAVLASDAAKDRNETRPSAELRALAGSWSSGAPDLGVRHDDYLGELQEGVLRNGKHE